MAPSPAADSSTGSGRSRRARTCQSACWRGTPIPANASAAASRRRAPSPQPEARHTSSTDENARPAPA
ncbi:MAG: hypothetical protein ACKORL_02165, partial [Phycisphaerales bacterium]